MKIYNEEKTQELNENELDFEFGYLKPDKLFIAHHDAIEAREAVYQDRTVKEENGSVSVYKDLIAPAVEGKEEWDEYEDIHVYVPYSVEEIEERKLNTLRVKRTSLLSAFDKWEKAVLRGRETDDSAVMEWYRDLLDLKEEAFETIPDRVRYYL